MTKEIENILELRQLSSHIKKFAVELNSDIQRLVETVTIIDNRIKGIDGGVSDAEFVRILKLINETLLEHNTKQDIQRRFWNKIGSGIESIYRE